MRAPAGIIEGFFGRPYSWDERRMMADALAPRGFVHWMYAPKADACLRRDWRQPHSEEASRHLSEFGSILRDRGMIFSVGLSPLGLNEGYDAAAQTALRGKVKQLLSLGIDALGLLFDDMKGDVPNLAATQVRIAHDVANWLEGRPLTLCPSYYSDDPILDRVFGKRPLGYLEELGQLLDPNIGIFWTGEKVCSPGYSADHLARTAETLRRCVTLWDNYPVNDGPRMYKKLHLRPFAARESCSAEALAVHMINPMTQAMLGLVSLFSLGDAGGSDRKRVHDSAMAALGPVMAELLADDFEALHELGLDAAPDQLAEWRHRYSAIDHPAACELVDWLDGKTAISLDEVQTQ